MPGDADKDNTYKVSVVATDKAGLTGMVEVSVEVTNVKEDGTVSLDTVQPAVGQPITATLSDPDTGETDLEWKWQSSSDGTAFADIEGATSATYTPAAEVPDDESTTDVDESADSDEGNFLRAIVTYTDDASDEDDENTADEDESEETAMGTTDLAVRVEPDVNGPPAFESSATAREVAEDKEKGDAAGMPVTATDPDMDSLSYEITGGADMDKFGMDDETPGQITVGSATFDYDDPSAQQTFEVEVTATDPFGMSGSTMVTLTATDVNEAPDFMADDPDDYAEKGIDAVAMFTATDPEGADIKWSTGGTDGSLFTAEGGALMFKDSPDYEDPKDMDHTADDDIEDDTDDAVTNNVYVVKVRATEVVPDDQEEPAEYTEIQVRVTVTNVNEDGMASINWRQPQVLQTLTATASDLTIATLTVMPPPSHLPGSGLCPRCPGQ